MCEVTYGVMAAGAALGVAGNLKAGRDAATNARIDAAVYQSQATARMEKANFDISQADNKFRRFEGTRIAHAAGSGIDSQSFYDAFADDAAESSLEKHAIIYTAQHDVQYLGYQADSSLRRGDQAQDASYFGAASSVVNAVAPFAAARYKAGLETSAAPGVSTRGYTGSQK